MRSAAEGDSALLLGGDLIVTVHQAEQLCGQERLTHPFARVREPIAHCQAVVAGWPCSSPAYCMNSAHGSHLPWSLEPASW